MWDYDYLTATRKNYEDFLDKFISGLKSLNYEGLSLIGHGSVFRKDYTAGVSDIDTVLIFPEYIITDKSKLNDVSDVIKDALKDNPLRFQTIPTDRGIIKYPLFSSLGSSWEKYFDKTEILLGPDYRSEVNPVYQMPQEALMIAFNLQKTRRKFLLAKHNQDINYGKFFEDFISALRAPASFPKYIHFLLEGELKPDRFATIDYLKELLPKLDVEPLKRIKAIYSNVAELRRLRKNPEELMKIWEMTITFFEQEIKEFVDSGIKIKI